MADRISHLQVTVHQDCNGLRALKYLTAHYRSVVGSKLRCQRSFRRGEVRVNGEVAEETRILKEGDLVELRYDKDEDERQTLERLDVDVVWEDDDVAVAWKVAGMNFNKFEKAVGLIVRKAKKNGESEHKNRGIGGRQRVWCVYQLEKAAYGLVGYCMRSDNRISVNPFNFYFPYSSTVQIIVAKTLQAKERLFEAFQNGEIIIRYRLICHGRVTSNISEILPTRYISHDGTTTATIQAANGEDGEDGENNEDDKNNEDDENNEDGDDVDDKAANTPSTAAMTNPLRSFALVSTSRSNSSSYLSTIDVWPAAPATGLHLRRFFYFSTKHPIVGGSTYTKPLKSNRDKGLYLAVLEVNFGHPMKKDWVKVEKEEPAKFEIIRAREQRFWERKKKEEEDELKMAGVGYIKFDGDEEKGGIYEGNEIDRVEYDGAENIPVAYIVGEKEFYSLRFKINRACLIPRPSTEIIVQSTLDILKQSFATQEMPSLFSRPIRILDIGTGCGNILLSVLYNIRDLNMHGVGIDISQGALDLAVENANRFDLSLHTTFLNLDLALLDKGHENSALIPHLPFDMIVCNPPYLSETTVARKDHYGALVDFEPREAIFSGEDGYECYRVLSQILRRGHGKLLRKDGGWLVLECGKGMVSRVGRMFEPCMKLVEVRKDRQGWERCLVLQMTDVAGMDL
ncbi:S-adenosyl-L-methionine-dependent methyltransferase [Jimgerdemannia flammicorona]|uniref:S-adenosyl-L-methionine-dependent methyltransferase n=1 Tax=Jimgerdemannia flammicorona TaxID=994334 RepID=A0A433QRJ1_9FUNG|nr:S-adenosyl-L-methionine-dependent methyltransferase [Jimgerdemannia flammicorona]